NDGVGPRRSGQARSDQLPAVVPLPCRQPAGPTSLRRSARPQGADRPKFARPFGLLAAVVSPIARSLVALPLGQSGRLPTLPHKLYSGRGKKLANQRSSPAGSSG